MSGRSKWEGLNIFYAAIPNLSPNFNRNLSSEWCLCISILQERGEVQNEMRERGRKKSKFTKQLETLGELEKALPKVEL